MGRPGYRPGPQESLRGNAQSWAPPGFLGSRPTCSGEGPSVPMCQLAREGCLSLLTWAKHNRQTLCSCTRGSPAPQRCPRGGPCLPIRVRTSRPVCAQRGRNGVRTTVPPAALLLPPRGSPGTVGTCPRCPRSPLGRGTVAAWTPFWEARRSEPAGGGAGRGRHVDWRHMAAPSQAHPTLGGEGRLQERPEQRRGWESPKNGEDKREEDDGRGRKRKNEGGKTVGGAEG